MGRLGANQIFGIAADHRAAFLRVHVGGVLFGGADHSRTNDIEQGQDPGFSARDDGILEVFEVLVAGAAGVHAGGHALRQAVGVKSSRAPSRRCRLSLRSVK